MTGDRDVVERDVVDADVHEGKDERVGGRHRQMDELGGPTFERRAALGDDDTQVLGAPLDLERW